jgi:hypothetical protein
VCVCVCRVKTREKHRSQRTQNRINIYSIYTVVYGVYKYIYHIYTTGIYPQKHHDLIASTDLKLRYIIMNYDSMKVDELKSELKRRGCTPSELKGKKAELLAKLMELVTAESAAPGDAAETPTISPTTQESATEESVTIQQQVENKISISNVSMFDAPVSEMVAIPTSSVRSMQSEGKTKEEKIAELKAKTARVAQEAQQKQLLALQPTNKKSCNVRIDNFIRPLTHKGLVQWLQDKLGSSIALAMNDVWVNGIKTHCYVTLPSEDVAAHLINSTNGCQWLEGTSGGGSTLSSDFTQISAHVADRSREAKLAPGTWKACAAENEASDVEPIVAVFESELSSSSIPVVRGRGAVAGIAGVLMKAVAASARDVPVTTAVIPQKIILQTRQVAPISSLAKHEREDNDTEVPTKRANLNKPLNELFRKTETKPHLYWLPLTDYQLEIRASKSSGLRDNT